MSLTQIYFYLGLAMFLGILWDYKMLPETARRLARQPDKNVVGFARIARESRNFAVMAVFVFFLWPIAMFWEASAAKK